MSYSDFDLKDVYIDLDDYSIDKPDRIVGILLAMVSQKG